jgi:quinol monooxygenase YgiN
MIHVIALITAHPGKRSEVLDAIRDNTPAVLAEPGCLEYRVLVDAAEPAPAWASFGPDTLVIVERWTSREALRAHAVAPHMQVYAAKVKELLASRAIYVLDPAG